MSEHTPENDALIAALAEHQRVNSNAAPCMCEEWPDGETDWPTHLAEQVIAVGYVRPVRPDGGA
jgi:hypothetical protein